MRIRKFIGLAIGLVLVILLLLPGSIHGTDDIFSGWRLFLPLILKAPPAPSPTPTSTPKPTATPVPSSTPTPTPTSIVTPTPVPGGLFTDCNAIADISPAECEGLVALFNNTDGHHWDNHSRWLVANTACTWHGVECGDGHVVVLRLFGNGLTGTLPGELAKLTYMKTLDLDFNSLNGGLPAAFGDLVNLQTLDLHWNHLSGGIPPELGNLHNLKNLDLSFQLNAGFTGTIPAKLGQLQNLHSLDISWNSLSGNVPGELGSLSQLEGLDLSRNTDLVGSVPLSFVNLSNLTYFHFSSTSLCEPPDPAFQIWLGLIQNAESTNVICSNP